MSENTAILERVSKVLGVPQEEVVKEYCVDGNSYKLNSGAEDEE